MATTTKKASGKGKSALKRYNQKRDFKRTPEPRGNARARRGALRYVIQKHDASHLHFDLRLELDGVMKSWAVPKGPSFDPSVKRLAMQVEDHPIDYNSFEGTIPEGEYGGGTVMLWDTGTYEPIEADGNAEDVLRAAYRKGDFKFRLRGKRLKGEWVLVRIKRGSPAKPQWLLIKHRDRYATSDVDPVEKFQRSVVSRRSMTGIASHAAH